MPETGNIISLPTPMKMLADRIRAAYERTERGRREWIDGTLELASALLKRANYSRQTRTLPRGSGRMNWIMTVSAISRERH